MFFLHFHDWFLENVPTNGSKTMNFWRLGTFVYVSLDVWVTTEQYIFGLYSAANIPPWANKLNKMSWTDLGQKWLLRKFALYVKWFFYKKKDVTLLAYLGII